MNATRTPADGSVGAIRISRPFRASSKSSTAKGDVRNDSDDLGHVAMRLEPDPLDPVGTGLKTGDVNPERRDMMLLSTRLRVWNPDVVVPPSELRCHGRRLMVQSHFAGHVSLHRSYSPIAIIWPVESAERERDKPWLALNNITAGVRERADANRTREAGHLDEIQGVGGKLAEVSSPRARWLHRLVRCLVLHTRMLA